jgi:hypothetical protein
MKSLPFLEELAEARLYFDADDVKGKSADDIAHIIFLMFMMIEVIRRSYPSWAMNYADQTMRYNTYENIHYSGTDLGNLLAVLNNQDTFKDKIKTNTSINIPLFQINRYLSAVRSNANSHKDDATFFWRLDDYLKAYNSPALRQLRRDVVDWENAEHADKERIVAMLRREMDKRSSSNDIYLWFRQNYRLKK